ncbi:MAG: hypothetical protein WD802_02970 [Gemmatimonadaceae bacterium]
MAVRDFVDLKGVKWKVWPVTPSAIRPKTAAEDYLGDYMDGWLVFESNAERRRLAQYPPNWDTLSDNGLLQLLKSAMVVSVRKTPERSGDAGAR